MIDAIIVVAILCACVGAWRGDLAAWALLASSGLTSLLIWRGAPFNLALWMSIDLAVIACIIGAHAVWHRRIAKHEFCIMALFMPAWALYPYHTRASVAAIDLIVSAQLMLTFPWRRLLSRPSFRRGEESDSGDNMLAVAHV